MGADKAALPWHGSTLLRRAVGLVARGADGPVVVVRSPGQRLPTLPADVEVLDDPAEGRGPLQGLAVGLAALADEADVAFVCATDAPLLHPALVAAVLRAVSPLAGDVDSTAGESAETRPDAVVPHVDGHRQPLAAAYATALADTAQDLVDAGRGGPGALLDSVRTRVLSRAQLLADSRLAIVDPRLCSLHDVDDPDAYAAALAEPAPQVRVRRFGVLATGGRSTPVDVRAWTLGDAAATVGLELDRHVVAAVNGDQAARDPETPLAQGDEVALLSADAGG